MPLLPRPHQGAINAHLLSHVRVGDELDVWWPLDNAYYPGVVGAVMEDGRHRIDYDDGDVERVHLRKERWKFRGDAADRVMQALLVPPKEAKSESPESEANVADDAEEEDEKKEEAENSSRSSRAGAKTGPSYGKVTKRRSAGGKKGRPAGVIK